MLLRIVASRNANIVITCARHTIKHCMVCDVENSNFLNSAV